MIRLRGFQKLHWFPVTTQLDTGPPLGVLPYQQMVAGLPGGGGGSLNPLCTSNHPTAKITDRTVNLRQGGGGMGGMGGHINLMSYLSFVFML